MCIIFLQRSCCQPWKCPLSVFKFWFSFFLPALSQKFFAFLNLCVFLQARPGHWCCISLIDTNSFSWYEFGIYILQSCSGVKEMYQSVWCTCIVIDLLIWHIAFLKFLLSSRLWHFKLPNVLHGQAISMLHNLSLNHQCKGVLYCALLLLFMLLFLKSLNL